MLDPRNKSYIVTLNIEAHSPSEVITRLIKVIEDERTISFDIKKKEEKHSGT